MWSKVLALTPGITAVIGSGGKTTLLHTLGLELSSQGHRVILCTSTRILPFPDIPFFPSLNRQILEKYPLVCTGTLLSSGKLGAPAASFQELADLADYILVEADGSNRLPLKAHLPHEPVIPDGSQKTICVVGLSGIGQPIIQSVHRPHRFSQLAGLPAEGTADAHAVASVLMKEHLADLYFLNQADLALPEGLLLGSLLPNAAVGSLKTGQWFL